MPIFKDSIQTHALQQNDRAVITNERGSVIVIALLLLVVLTLGGITATTRTSTESWSVRNHAIYKQNLQLAESAVLEGAREIMNRNEEPRENIEPEQDDDWIIRVSDWGRVHPAISERRVAESASTLLQQRGENNSLRYYVVGWSPAPDESWIEGEPGTIKRGTVVGVYETEGQEFSRVSYGRRVIEVGIELAF